MSSRGAGAGTTRRGPTGRPDPLGAPLDAAAGAILRAHEARPLDPPFPATLRAELDTLVESVRGAAVGELPRPSAPASVDRRLLLGELRGALLESWPEAHDAPLLAAMRAFQAVEDALVAAELGGPTEVERTLGPFAYMVLSEVSHMLRSPLGAMVMMADTLADGPGAVESEVHRHRLRIIHRAALGLAVLSDDLFTLARQDQGLEAPSTLIVSELVNDVTDVVRPVCQARSTELVVHGLEEVAAPRTGLRRTLRQALVNVVLQAALRTRDGRVELTLDEGDAESIVFSVSEPAVAMSAPDLFGVFRRHQENDDVTISGDGLRLATARKLVRAMGSDVEATTEADRLTVSFRLVLPAAF